MPAQILFQEFLCGHLGLLPWEAIGEIWGVGAVWTRRGGGLHIHMHVRDSGNTGVV